MRVHSKLYNKKLTSDDMYAKKVLWEKLGSKEAGLLVIMKIKAIREIGSMIIGLNEVLPIVFSKFCRMRILMPGRFHL